MKITVVPAQVTTVEDRIMGNLSFSQMILVITPIFIGGALFAFLPPAFGSSPYKYILMGVIALLCIILAIRIRGKIVALWLATVLRYNLRPTYYLFNKNTSSLRQDYKLIEANETVVETALDARTPVRTRLSLQDASRALATIDNPASHIRFETTKKGGLYVRLTEIEE